MENSIIWNVPNGKTIFWVPNPEDPFQRRDEIPGREFTVTDSATKKEHKCKIVDYLGPYDFEQMPDFLAVQCWDDARATKKTLFQGLKKHKPEFKDAERIYFFQLTKIENDSKKTN